MTQYAGEVRIKTKLDAEGVSKGLGEVGAKMRGIGNAVGNGMSGVFAKVNNGVKAAGAKLSSLGGMAAIGISQGMALAGDAIVAVTNLFKDMMKMEGFKEKFAEAELAFTNLQNAAYSALMPLMELLLPIIMQVVDWLTRAANVAAAFFAALSGSSTYMTYVASGMAKAGGSSGKYADNMERAEKAAKGSLASFDKIDVLNKKETPEIKIPGGGGGGGAIGEWVEQSVEDTFASLSDGWGAFIDGLLLLFKDGDWSGLGDWFKEFVWEPIKTKAIEIWEPIKTKAIEIWEQFKEDISASWEEVKAWIRDNITTPIGEFFANAWNAVVQAWESASAWFNKTVIQPLIEVFAPIVTWFKDDILAPIKEAWGELVSKLTELVGVIRTKIVEPIVKLFKDVLYPRIKDVLDWLSKLFSTVWEAIKTTVLVTVGALWAGLQVAWGWIKAGFGVAFNTIKTIFMTVLEVVSSIIEMIIGIFTGIIDFVIGVFTGDWERAWDGIKQIFTSIWEGIRDTIKSIINGIIGFINGMISGIVSGINAIIGVLNKLSFKIPDWIPELGGQSFGFNIAPITAPQIPLLATGAVIPPNAPFAAILGDQKSGRNIETPEGLLRDLIREELSKASGGQQEVTVNFAGTMGALVRAMNPYIENERTRRGGSLAKGVNIA